MNTLTPSQQLADIKARTGLAENAIAERLGCSQPTVNRILSGKSDCKASTLLKIQSWHAELVAAEESGERAA